MKTLSWQSLPNQFRCFFKVARALFFLTRSLIDRCQIVTDTCKNNVSNFVWKPFKLPLSLRKWKCFGEASLFSLYHLYFNDHLLAQKYVGFFLERISLSLKKIKMLFTGLRTRAVLKTSGTVFPIRTSRLANNVHLLFKDRLYKPHWRTSGFEGGRGVGDGFHGWILFSLRSY